MSTGTSAAHPVASEFSQIELARDRWGSWGAFGLGLLTLAALAMSQLL